MRIVRLLSLLIAFILNASVVLAADLTSQDLEKLSSYETKLFAHPFSTDTVAARLDRIEDFVFGKTSDGSDSDRLNSVVSAMGAAETENPKKEEVSSKPSSEANAVAKPKQSGREKTKEEQPSAPAESVNDHVASAPAASESPGYDDVKLKRTAQQSHKKDKALASAPVAKATDTASSQPASRDPIETGEGFKKTDYPRVSKLELRLLGLTYDQDPLDERVDRLEIKAFKKPSNIDDLGQRIDALEKLIPPSRKIAYAPSPDSGDDLSTPVGKSNSHSDWDEGEGKIASARPSNSYSYPDPYASPESYSGADPYTWTSPSSSSNQLNGGRNSYSSNNSISSGASGSFYSPPPSVMNAPVGATPARKRQTGSLDKEADTMEKEVLGKTFKHDGLVDRLNRLEATVFPGQAAPQGMNIPQRFNRLQEALGSAGGNRTATAGGDQKSDWYNNNGNPNAQTGVLANQEKRSFMGSLGKALGAVAGGAMNSFNSMNSPYGYGSPYGGYGSPYGGYGGYSPYGGYSNYGGYGSPYGGGFGSPYGGGLSNFGSPFGSIGGFGSPFGSPMGGFGTGFGSPFGGTYTGLPGTGFGGIGGIGSPYGGANRVWIR
jgi:hypothetical protein